ncbi:MAG: four helix bundle protein [Cytophagales bacterium]|nr:four helix bundle protein [Cytophagales bacterium]
MKKESVLLDKSFVFAVRIVRLYKYIVENRRETILSKQMMRSGTAVGALIREAQNAESKADFVHKLGVAQKECDETRYWLELLKEADYLSEKEFDSIHTDALEILKIIRSAILTSKRNNSTLTQKSQV